MRSASTLPRVPTGTLASALQINLWADVQLADGSTKTFRIQALEDLLPLVVAKAGGNGVPVLDASGTLVLAGISMWSVNANGHLAVPEAAIPETSNGFTPVAGSGVIYTDGGILKRAL